MEELLKAVSEKTGLPADKAQGAIEAVLDFLKDKLPEPIAGQLENFIGGGDDEGSSDSDSFWIEVLEPPASTTMTISTR